MKDYTINKTYPLSVDQNEAVDFMISRPYCINACQTGLGKGQPIDTIIPTTKGDKLFGDLQIGDYIFSNDGKPTKVIGIYPKGFMDIYRVSFADKSYLDVSIDHLWTILFKDRKQNIIKDVDTKFLIDYFKDKRIIKNRRSELYIPLTQPIDINLYEPKCDLYVLGSLLADGCLINKYQFNYTKYEYSVVEEFRKRCFTNNKRKGNHYCIPKSKNKLLFNAIEYYGLLNLKSAEKFIPEELFYTSIENRVLLLQGLMDGDGSITHTSRTLGPHQYLYATTSKQLANDILRLITSLGGYGHINIINDKKYHPNKYLDDYFLYYIQYKLPSFINPFLKSKWGAYKEVCSIKDINFCRQIKSVEKLDMQKEIRCIRVEAENSLYIADNKYHIVTHNTYLSLTALMHLLVANKDMVGIVCVPPKALKVFRKELEEKLKIQYSEISTQNNINKNSRVILISHTKLADCVPMLNEFLKIKRPLAMILDEAHKIAAENNQLTKTVIAIRPFLKYCWFLTATPCGNDIWGLYNLVSIINPDVLVDKNTFKNNYLITEYRKTKKWNPGLRRFEFPWEEVIVGYKNTDKLSEALKDTIIIKQKQYNLEFVYHKTDITEEEKEAYFKASAGLARKTAEKNWAVRLNDLQRVIDNSSPKYSDKTKLSSKETLLIKTVNELIDNHILIVYTELNDNVERLNMLFTKLKGMTGRINNIHIINGQTTFKERGLIESKITNHDIIIITQAGTESINLQKADSVIFYDTPYSLIQVIQCIGRVTRTDTKFNKQYLHFIEAQGTVDTYRRLNVVKNASLITQLFGPISTLPIEINLIDANMQKKLRNKLLWSFKSKRLPTDEEIEQLLNNV